jgi:hypothetical protein
MSASWHMGSLEPFIWTSKKKFPSFKKFQKICGHSQLYTLRSWKFIIWNTMYYVFGKNNKKSDLECEQCCVCFFQNLSNLSFILSLRNKVFRIENFHGYSVCSWLHQDIILNFWIFWNFKIWIFWCLKNRAPEPGS